MSKSKKKIIISDIILDESIYPRKKIDQKRVSVFAEKTRDGFNFDLIRFKGILKKKGKIEY